MRPPTWIRDGKPSAEAAAAQKLRTDAAKTRVHLHGVGHLPVDQEAAAWELTEEQRALRGSRPRNRRWKQLTKIDHRTDELRQKLADATARLQQAEEAVTAAPRLDAEKLAAWIEAGENEPPAASLPERERERDARRLVVDAIQLEIDKALEHRQRPRHAASQEMLEEARKDVDAARSRLLEHASVLPALREALVSARETLIWCATYPDPPETFGNPHNVALGLLEPVRRTLGTKARLDYAAVLAALEEDANALAEAYAEPVKQALGTAKPADPTKVGKWWDDPNDHDLAAWKREQLERARQLAEWATRTRSRRKFGRRGRDYAALQRVQPAVPA